MEGNLVYVHIENISHMTLSYGVTNRNFVAAARSAQVMPQNLLLISPVDTNQEIDISTGFNIVTGQENVSQYLLSKQVNDRRWIDFDDQYDLEQLTPGEVAGMLYLGHAYMHLQSPFYYKLQNMYAFLTLPNGALKIYFRHMKQFHRVLAYSLTDHIAQAFREKRRLFFMQWPRRFSLFPFELSSKLQTIYNSGAVFDFDDCKIQGQKITVPILLAPDTIYQVKWHEPTMLVERSEPVANLTYSLKDKKWELKINNKSVFDTQYL